MTVKAQLLTELARTRGQQSQKQLSTGKTDFWYYPAKGKSRGNLVLIHGYRGTHHGLEAIVGSLEDFNCWVPDLPGFGDSEELTGEHSIENYSRWLEEFLHSLDQKRLIVAGHSFGTLVVSKWATREHRHPVVLINPVSAPALTSPRVLLAKATRSFYSLAEKLSPKLGRFLLSHPIAVWAVTEFMYRADVPDLKRWIALQHRTYFSRFASVKSVVQGFRASVSCSVGDFAPQISQKTLLICCERDDVTSIETQRSVATFFSNATYVEVPKLGHLIHYEGPEIIADNIRDFYRVSV